MKILTNTGMVRSIYFMADYFPLSNMTKVFQDFFLFNHTRQISGRYLQLRLRQTPFPILTPAPINAIYKNAQS